FTYHGFRYVELTGMPEKPTKDTVTGVVLHSDTPLVSEFSCSDEMVNQLFRNVVWTQRANFFEVPTDCPQRDERLGWTGDAQVYVRTATYNADVAAFFTKWLDDLEESQLESGAYPAYAPFPYSGRPEPFGTAWMDAGIICPFTIHQVYGDKRVIERHYESMKRFIEFRQRINPSLKGEAKGAPWGDWLSLGNPTPLEYIDVNYFAYSTRLMAEMAEALGKSEDARAYRQLFDNIQKAFLVHWVRDGGALTVDSQTAYALALFSGLLPEEMRQPAADRLAQMIRDNGNRMGTGF
ncbi:MAG: family 78 glycoside hydrolase catalytic domain, partial [bacterium]|nr:family 78 glycoside hydrolase catalytic domain [bacterium]